MPSKKHALGRWSLHLHLNLAPRVERHRCPGRSRSTVARTSRCDNSQEFFEQRAWSDHNMLWSTSPRRVQLLHMTQLYRFWACKPLVADALYGIIIIIILRERQTRSPKAIEHTQVRLQPEPGALCTGLQPCQLASAPMKPSRSTPPSYTDAEGPSLANHPKAQDVLYGIPT